MSIFTLLGFSQAALAIPPTFTIIGPQEFALPIPEPGKGIGFFFQNTVYTDDNKGFDDNGDTIDAIGGGHSLFGISRFGRLFSFKALPKVAFYWEYLQPEIYINSGDGNSITGLADPLIGTTAYVDPIEGLTLGIENFVSIPVGNDNLTNGGFQTLPNIFADYSFGDFGVDFFAGANIKADSNVGGTSTDVGNDYYADVRFRYTLNDWLKPFVAYDYAYTAGGSLTRVPAAIPGAATPSPQVGDAVDSTEQHVAGVGTVIYINSAQTGELDVWYDYGFSGKNTTRVNGVFTKFIWLFP